MTASALKKIQSLSLFEIMPSLRGSFIYLAFGSLLLLVIPVRIIFAGDFVVNGQAVGMDPRLNYVIAVGYSILVFLTTLFSLTMCLDRAGTDYLRNNDLLILARSVTRPAFYFSKMFSVLIPVIIFEFLAITLFWEELYRIAGINLFQLFFLIGPLTLGMICLISLYFLMRHFMGSFMIIFVNLLLLPIIYVANLWRYYAGHIRENVPQFPLLGVLPQFGGVHAYSLGLIGDQFCREDTWLALLNVTAWTIVACLLGLWLFTKKRL